MLISLISDSSNQSIGHVDKHDSLGTGLTGRLARGCCTTEVCTCSSSDGQRMGTTDTRNVDWRSPRKRWKTSQERSRSFSSQRWREWMLYLHRWMPVRECGRTGEEVKWAMDSPPRERSVIRRRKEEAFMDVLLFYVSASIFIKIWIRNFGDFLSSRISLVIFLFT